MRVDKWAAQQFAYTSGPRCRRLILAATTPGVLMIPGRLSLLRRMFDARRYNDPQYMTRIAAELYGGAVRRCLLLMRRRVATRL